MMIASLSDVIGGLIEATVALTAATAIALLIRRPLRRYCGACVAYAVWWLLPISLLALALPAPTVEVLPQARAIPSAALGAVSQTTAPQTDFGWLWLALWACGVAVVVAYQWRLQRRFLMSLGRLRIEASGLWRAQIRHGLPALIGAFRPRIVLPVDFESRYDPHERALMLAHERAHLQRGDPLANLAAAVLRSVFWFHPLVHLAASCFRADQELACDQRVIASVPHARRAYGEAMLKTLVVAQPIPLGCHWGHAHPLKERLMQLSTPPPRRSARMLGIAIAVALSAGTAFTVWSAQSPRPVMRAVAAHAQPLSDFRAVIASRIDDGAPASFAIENAYGKPFSFMHEDAGTSLDVEATVRSAGIGRYDIAAIVKREGMVVATPRLIAEAGKSAVVRIGDGSASNGFRGIEVDFIVRPSAGVAAAPEALPRMGRLVSTGMAAATAPQAIGREAPLAPLPGMEAVPLPPLPDMEAGPHPPLPHMQTAPLPPLPAMASAPIGPRPQLAARSHSKHEPPPAPPMPPPPPAPPEPPTPPEPPEPPTPPEPPAAPSKPTSVRAMKTVSLVSIHSLKFLAPQPSGANDGC